jgi:predicted metalloprotease with PDZ domain
MVASIAGREGPEYLVEIEDAAAHLFRVSLRLPQPRARQRLSLPVWIPGSYLVREFSRHLGGLRARQGRSECRCVQVDKCTWEVACKAGEPLHVQWQVYAFDTSVRAAFLSAERAFFNGTSLLLRAEGSEARPQRLRLAALPAGWRVATAMTPLQGATNAFVAADYDELVDHPFELGNFWDAEFEAGGVSHRFVVAGAWPGFEGERLVADTQAICETQIAFWHGAHATSGKAKNRPPRTAVAPFERYVFLLHAMEDGYGGLEHRASTALIAKRADLPRPGLARDAEGYVRLLGLISHEYFHTWNVKRLRPAELVPLDYGRENLTELLWFFEGFTSYFDDWLLLQSGRIDASQYLGLLGKTIQGVLSTPGRLKHPLSQASFEAWTKYYRADENTPNWTVSYYTKGSLVALALDLRLRQQAERPDLRAHGLGALMRALWRRSGAARAYSPGAAGRRGGALTMADIEAELDTLAGPGLVAELRHWVHGSTDLPLQALLDTAAVHWVQTEPAGLAARWGLRVDERMGVKQVLAGGAAQAAGLSVGDELIAIDGWRVRTLDDAKAWLPAQGEAALLVSRGQRVLMLKLRLPELAQAPQVALAAAAAAAEGALALRRAWLGA